MKSIIILISLFLLGCQPKTVIEKTETIQPSEIISEEELSYEDIQKEYMSKYCERDFLDTIVKLDDQEIKIMFEHYCLFDTIIIPSKYDWSDSPKDFFTHNYASKILIVNDGDTITSILIEKDFFNSLLDENLVKYGVLLHPNYKGFNKEQNAIQIQYSISIPLTDIGMPVILDIKSNGDIYSE